jgi:uncharacterized protein
MVTRQLLQAIIAQHHLRGTHSIHFIDHWARVLEIGRFLAAQTGARLDVVEMFAVFHDSGRMNDGGDYDHGPRGADLARLMEGQYFHLDPAGMDLLLLACREHTLGKLDGNITVQTCWDSDRLDLGRAAIKPVARRLCTAAARDQATIDRTYEQSIRRHIPADIYTEWGLDSLASAAVK